jgi:glutaredoxin
MALLLLGAASPSHALFKVVAADGTVTYTDRPPPAQIGRQAPAAKDAAADPSAGLPYELRQVVTRYRSRSTPATTAHRARSGRRLLQGRGVPFTERRVESNDDAEALNRITGGRSVPTLTIGAQALRGYSDGDWHSYLDAAGYPRDSRLPRNYQQPAATPLVQQKAEPAPAAAAAPVPEPPVAPPPTTAPSPTGIRF